MFQTTSHNRLLCNLSTMTKDLCFDNYDANTRSLSQISPLDTAVTSLENAISTCNHPLLTSYQDREALINFSRMIRKKYRNMTVQRGIVTEILSVLDETQVDKKYRLFLEREYIQWQMFQGKFLDPRLNDDKRCQIKTSREAANCIFKRIFEFKDSGDVLWNQAFFKTKMNDGSSYLDWVFCKNSSPLEITPATNSKQARKAQLSIFCCAMAYVTSIQSLNDRLRSHYEKAIDMIVKTSKKISTPKTMKKKRAGGFSRSLKTTMAHTVSPIEPLRSSLLYPECRNNYTSKTPILWKKKLKRPLHKKPGKILIVKKI